MSLLIVNGSSLVALGFAKRAFESKMFKKILISDLYPNYYPKESVFRFLSSLKSDTSCSISDTKISVKSELEENIKESSHVVHFTHPHYSLVPSKFNLLKDSVDFCKTYKIKDFVSVNPIGFY